MYVDYIYLLLKLILRYHIGYLLQQRHNYDFSVVCIKERNIKKKKKNI